VSPNNKNTLFLARRTQKMLEITFLFIASAIIGLWFYIKGEEDE
jgi:hypothetical protein|tara:strand:+ start:537 stop:668 length:132 start_codon:yes stop_codon:yes gene_type:complete